MVLSDHKGARKHNPKVCLYFRESKNDLAISTVNCDQQVVSLSALVMVLGP